MADYEEIFKKHCFSCTPLYLVSRILTLFAEEQNATLMCSNLSPCHTIPCGYSSPSVSFLNYGRQLQERVASINTKKADEDSLKEVRDELMKKIQLLQEALSAKSRVRYRGNVHPP